MSDLYKVMLLKDQHCILILGLDNAVRTTVLERSKTWFHKNSKGRSLSKITATVGLNISTVDVGKARLLLCGLAGGQEELQSLWYKDQAEGHGVLYVMGSTEERLSEYKRWRRWSRARRWAASPSWCWPASRTLRLASGSVTSKLRSGTAPPRSGGRDSLTQACTALTGKGLRESVGEVRRAERAPAAGRQDVTQAQPRPLAPTAHPQSRTSSYPARATHPGAWGRFAFWFFRLLCLKKKKKCVKQL